MNNPKKTGNKTKKNKTKTKHNNVWRQTNINNVKNSVFMRKS